MNSRPRGGRAFSSAPCSRSGASGLGPGSPCPFLAAGDCSPASQPFDKKQQLTVMAESRQVSPHLFPPHKNISGPGSALAAVVINCRISDFLFQLTASYSPFVLPPSLTGLVHPSSGMLSRHRRRHKADLYFLYYYIQYRSTVCTHLKLSG